MELFENYFSYVFSSPSYGRLLRRGSKRGPDTPPNRAVVCERIPEELSNAVKSKEKRAYLRHVLMAMVMMSASGAVVLHPGAAWAQSEQEIAREVEKLSAEASERYYEKDYAAAIDLFQKAYALDPVPTLLFNIAKCYEKQQQWDEAIDFYELFVVEPDIDSEERKTAMERINKLREIKDTQQDIEDKNKDPDGPNGGDGSQQQSGGEGGKKGPSPIPGYVLLGGGIAALAGGGYFGLQAYNNEQLFEQSSEVSVKQSAREQGRRQAIIADGLYAGGAILSTIGVVLLVRASRVSEAKSEQKSKDEAEQPRALLQDVEVAPVFGRGLQGLSLQLRF